MPPRVRAAGGARGRRGDERRRRWRTDGDAAQPAGRHGAPRRPPRAVATPPQPLQNGANTIPLDAFGRDFLGATITFDAQRLGVAVKITSARVHATGPKGLHVVHPLFIGVRLGVKHPDPVDTLDGYDQFIPNAMSAPLGPGL